MRRGRVGDTMKVRGRMLREQGSKDSKGVG